MSYVDRHARLVGERRWTRREIEADEERREAKKTNKRTMGVVGRRSIKTKEERTRRRRGIRMKETRHRTQVFVS